MGVAEEGGRVATSITESLKGQPLALALVIINVLFLIAFAFGLRSIAAAVERKDVLLADLAKRCTASLLPNGSEQ